MAIQDRNTLKRFFRKGQMPSESNFHDMIDSAVNKVDDGLSKNVEDGLMLSPTGSSKKMVSFYKNIQDKSSIWSLNLDKGNSNLHFANYVGDSVLCLTEDGNIGINNDDPQYQLDVGGIAAMQGRIGTFVTGKIPADGQWHPILSELNGCHIFEIVGGVGKKKAGMYGLVHAIAVATYGDSRHKISITQSRYGSRRNRIQLRWKGDTYNFNLEMRTRTDYGGSFMVQYHLTNLWFDEYMDNCLDEE